MSTDFPTRLEYLFVTEKELLDLILNLPPGYVLYDVIRYFVGSYNYHVFLKKDSEESYD